MSANTRSARTMVTGTVGTSAITILAANSAANYVRAINPALPGGHNLQVTYDGTTPVVGSVGVPLYPGGTDTNDQHVPTGKVQIIADTAGTPYCLEWA